MATTYQVWLATRGGTLVKPLYDFVSLDVSMIVNGIGYARLELPGVSYNLSEFVHKYRIIIKRNGAVLGNAAYYITGKEEQLSESGEYIISVEAAHANHFLADRHHMYYAGSTDATATAEEADDLMKRIIRLNLAENAQDADRDKAAPLNVVSVEGDTTQGPQLTKAFARRNMLTVLQELSQSAREAGTAVYFGLVDPSGTGTPSFKTRITQWGNNRTSGLPVSPEMGNLTGAGRTKSFNAFASVAYSLGQGTGASRAIGEAENTSATGESDLLFIEATIQANNTSTANGLADEADALLRNSRVSNVLRGTLQETDTFLYGVDWILGDQRTAVFNGEVFTCFVNRVNVRVEGGRETITASLEADNIKPNSYFGEVVSRITELENRIDRNNAVEA